MMMRLTLTVISVCVLVGCKPSQSDPQAKPTFQEQTRATPEPVDVVEPVVSVAPRRAVQCVYRQEITTQLGVVRAGTAFVARAPGSEAPILVSAIHLLGPAGGLERNVPARDIPSMVEAISISGLLDSSIQFEFGAKSANLLDAAPLGEDSTLGDVMAFMMPNDLKIDTLAFSETPLRVGDPVWLVAQVAGGAPSNQGLHQGKYLGTDAGGNFKIEFLNNGLDLRATSGAPVVNVDGDVVAVNLAGMTNDSILYGFGNPTSRFLHKLRDSARESLSPSHGGE